MSVIMVASSHEGLFRIGMKLAWGVVACTSLYAVLTPLALLDLNQVFWGILLFVSLLAIPSGIATDRACASIWGILLLGLSIIYVIFLRDYQTADGAPIRDIDFLQTLFSTLVSAAGMISGLRRACVWEDDRGDKKG